VSEGTRKKTGRKEGRIRYMSQGIGTGRTAWSLITGKPLRLTGIKTRKERKKENGKSMEEGSSQGIDVSWKKGGWVHKKSREK